MSHDCYKVAVKIQFVFINSHEQGGDNSEELGLLKLFFRLVI